MKKIAIIPARGGSKRIPRKNIKDFLGKPIMAYSIDAALTSGIFDEVMVSTDDGEIAEIAKRYGASVPFMRSSKNSDDHSTTIDALIEVLNGYNNIGQDYSIGCCIYPCAPFVTADVLKDGYTKLTEDGFNFIFTATAFESPIQRALRKNEQGRISSFYPEFSNVRTQDLEKAYHDAGQFYWFRTKSLIQNKSVWNDNTGMIEINNACVQDIDTLNDWSIAEVKYKHIHHRA